MPYHIPTCPNGSKTWGVRGLTECGFHHAQCSQFDDELTTILWDARNGKYLAHDLAHDDEVLRVAVPLANNNTRTGPEVEFTSLNRNTYYLSSA